MQFLIQPYSHFIITLFSSPLLVTQKRITNCYSAICLFLITIIILLFSSPNSIYPIHHLEIAFLCPELPKIFFLSKYLCMFKYCWYLNYWATYYTNFWSMWLCTNNLCILEVKIPHKQFRILWVFQYTFEQNQYNHTREHFWSFQK